MLPALAPLAQLLANPWFWGTVGPTLGFTAANIYGKQKGSWKERAEFDAMREERKERSKTAAMLAGYAERQSRKDSRQRALDRDSARKAYSEQLAQQQAADQLQALFAAQAMESAAASDMIQGVPRMARFRSQEIMDAAMTNSARGMSFADMLFG